MGIFDTTPIGAFSGVKITQSSACYEMVPLFPDKKRSKRRDRRVRGKYGRLDRMNPLTYKTPFGFVMHPILYAKLKGRTTPT